MLSQSEFTKKYPKYDQIGKGRDCLIYESNLNVVKRWTNDDSALMELYLLKRIRSPYIISYLNYTVYGGGTVEMAMPKGRNLYEYLDEFGMTFSLRRLVLFNILCALEFLHKHNIIHFDIRPANIIVLNGFPVLIDFGLARLTKDGKLLTNIYVGHVLEDRSVRDRVYSTSHDLYTFGRSLIMMDPGLDRSAYEVLRKMVLPIDQRPTASELLTDPYFDGMTKEESLFLPEPDLPPEPALPSWSLIEKLINGTENISENVKLSTLLTLRRIFNNYPPDKIELVAQCVFSIVQFLLDGSSDEDVLVKDDAYTIDDWRETYPRVVRDIDFDFALRF